MELIPIKTRILIPPEDDLFAAMDASSLSLQEQDVVLISSKVVAIGEGNCVPVAKVGKKDLVAQESELTIPRDYWGTPLTVKHGAFIGMAGIDASNANGHYVLLPKDPFVSAEKIHAHLTKRFSLEKMGVIVTDSHSTPLRRGAMGIAIGWWGFHPTKDCRGKKDLFDREFRLEVENVVDGLAAGANVVMGETNECTPMVVARGVPNLSFTATNTRDELIIPPEEDTFRVLYERFL